MMMTPVEPRRLQRSPVECNRAQSMPEGSNWSLSTTFEQSMYIQNSAYRTVRIKLLLYACTTHAVLKNARIKIETILPRPHSSALRGLHHILELQERVVRRLSIGRVHGGVQLVDDTRVSGHLGHRVVNVHHLASRHRCDRLPEARVDGREI